MLSPLARVTVSAVAFAGSLLAVVSLSLAGDWPGFRGPNADNVSPETGIPLEWSDSKNLAWKVNLPGPGSSSPIVHGSRVYVTCYSGYGVSRQNPGSIDELKRHLVCLDAKTGEVLFDKAVDSAARDDDYRGFITEHGYASSTPVTDGENVYCFFGKTEVVAFTRDGKKLWQVSVGTESSNRRWGSGASLLLYKDSVIVNASEESQSHASNSQNPHGRNAGNSPGQRGLLQVGPVATAKCRPHGTQVARSPHDAGEMDGQRRRILKKGLFRRICGSISDRLRNSCFSCSFLRVSGILKYGSQIFNVPIWAIPRPQ